MREQRKKKPFVKADVVRYNKQAEFEALDNIDSFISDINTQELHLLDAWEAHFKEMGVPYAVTMWSGDGSVEYRLWKEMVKPCL